MIAEQQYGDSLRERRLRVLLVEHNAEARERVRAALDPHYDVTFAAGMAEALSAVRARATDLVVTEVDLADGDGLALCERVRLLPEGSTVPIMLLTGRSSITDKVAGFQAGADDYVVKPVDTRLLPARIKLLCRIKGLEHPRERGA